MTIAEFTPIIVALVGLFGAGGFVVQRILIRKQADNAVVTGATGVVDLYRTYIARLDADLAVIRENCRGLESRLIAEEQRCNRLQAALIRHGIPVEEF